MKSNDKIVLLDGVGSENSGSRARELSIVTEQGQLLDAPDRDKMQSELVKDVCCDMIFFLEKLVKIADELKKYVDDSSDYKNILECEGNAICKIIGEYYLVIAEKNRPWIAADLYEKWTVAGNKYIKYTIDDFIRSSDNISKIELLYSAKLAFKTKDANVGSENNVSRERQLSIVTEQDQFSDTPDRDKMQSELVKDVCCDTIFFLEKLVKIAEELKKYIHDSSDYKNILECEGNAICKFIGEYYFMIAYKNRSWITPDLYEKWAIEGSKYIKYTIDDFMRSSDMKSKVGLSDSDLTNKEKNAVFLDEDKSAKSDVAALQKKVLELEACIKELKDDKYELRKDKEMLVDDKNNLLIVNKYFQGLTVKQSAQIATLKKLCSEQQVTTQETIYCNNDHNHCDKILSGENPQEALGYDYAS